MNILKIITNIEVRAMVAANPVAINSARTAYRLGCDYLRACCGHKHKRQQTEELYDSNITHNLCAMAEAAGIYKHLWRPACMKTSCRSLPTIYSPANRILMPM